MPLSSSSSSSTGGPWSSSSSSSSSTGGHSSSSSSSSSSTTGGGSRGGGAPPAKTDPCKCGCKCCQAGVSTKPVRYFNGEFRYEVRALESAGFGIPWGHTRSWNNQLLDADELPTSVDVVLGYNWIIEQMPYVHANDNEYVVALGMGRALFFTKSGSTFVPKFGGENLYHLELSGTLLVLTEPDGTRWEFQDVDQPSLGGWFSRAVSPGGQVTEVISYGAYGISDVRRTDPTSSITEQFLYEYYTSGVQQGRLQQVTLRRTTDGVNWTNVRREAYTYYDGSDSFGNLGDLKTAIIQNPSGLSSWTDDLKYYYRYYKDAAAGKGFQHGLKYVINPEAYRRLVAALQDPLTATDATLAKYADYYLEYNSDQQVTKETVMGGQQTYTYIYDLRTGTLTDDYNQWRRRTIMTRPDGATVTVFTNYIGQVILTELKQGSKSWVDHFQFDSDAHDILHAHPSAVTSWSLANLSSALTINLNSSDGLIELTEYPSSTTATESTPGDALGHEKNQKIKRGTSGTPIILRQTLYFQHTTTSTPVFPVARETVYRNDDGSGAVATNYSYTWHDGGTSAQMEQRTTTLPPVSGSQNGSGSSDIRLERFSKLGELLWVRDERGFITRNIYDPATGALVQTIADVNTANVSDEPAGWGTPAGGGLHLVTDYTVDSRGRVTLVKGPVQAIDLAGVSTNVRSITTTLYLDQQSEIRTAQGYATGANYDSYTLYNPISITKLDDADRVIEQIQATQGTNVIASGILSDTFAQTTYVRWTTNIYNDQGQLTATRVYNSIPASGTGSGAINYLQTKFTYDNMGRQSRVATPGGTVTITTYDPRDLPLTVSVGTDPFLPDPTPNRRWQNPNNRYDVDNDGFVTSSDSLTIINFMNAYGSGDLNNRPTPPPGPAPDKYVDVDGDDNVTASDSLAVINFINSGQTFADENKVLVVSYEYDNNSATGGKDGNLTKETRFVDNTGTNDRVTTYTYDWRNRRTILDGELDLYVEYTYDNLDRVTETVRKSGTGTKIGRELTKYDDLGRVYQTVRYAVNVSSGTEGTYQLTDNTWYDATGNVAKQLPAGSKAFTKMQYDGIGRVIKTFVGYDTAESSYLTALDVSGDTIFEQTENAYDAAGNVILATNRRRLHNATGTGELTNPSGTQPRARVSYVANWHDGIGRLVASANYGTNGGTTLSRPTTAPSSSALVLVTRSQFNARGEAYRMIDPMGRIDEVQFDHAGRQTKTIQNYNDGDPTTGTDPSQDVTVEYVYNRDGRILTLKARQQATANDQVTIYTYGSIGSAISSNNLLYKVAYPDSADSTDVVTYKYNRQGQVTQMTDQNGNVHAYDYDKLGRQTADRITTLGTGVDGAVRRIETSYEARGLVSKITSRSTDAGAPTANVVNDVQNDYNEFGQLIAQHQSHAGLVVPGTTPKVQYVYANGSANHVRLGSIIYPTTSKVLNYSYGSAGSDADNLSRVASLADVATTVASYSYLGLGMVVKVDYPETSVAINMNLAFGAGNDPNDGGLDRFDRVVDMPWTKTTTGDLARIAHGYDQASNRLWRQDVKAATSNLDELYTYDGMYQLKSSKRGRLDATKAALTAGALKFEQDWNFDPLGNWTQFQEDTDGVSGFNFTQTRAHNKANEITSIGSISPPTTPPTAWVTPAFDRDGNMTTMPQPALLTSSFTATYDAWNRLVKLASGTTTVAQYKYDGQNWRIATITASPAETRDHYYTSSWQLIEDRVGGSTLDRQFIWGVRYIDDLVLRTRPTGTERKYALQDPNWNVVAVYDKAVAAIQERYSYSAYGTPQVLDAAFASRASSLYDWEFRYAGYKWDKPSGGLLHVRNRDLHTQLGRWITRDPFGYTPLKPSTAPRSRAFPELLLYTYTHGRTSVYIDGLGLAPYATCHHRPSALPFDPNNFTHTQLFGDDWPTFNSLKDFTVYICNYFCFCALSDAVPGPYEESDWVLVRNHFDDPDQKCAENAVKILPEGRSNCGKGNDPTNTPGPRPSDPYVNRPCIPRYGPKQTPSPVPSIGARKREPRLPPAIPVIPRTPTPPTPMIPKPAPPVRLPAPRPIPVPVPFTVPMPLMPFPVMIIPEWIWEDIRWRNNPLGPPPLA